MVKEVAILKLWQTQLFQELVELLNFHDSNQHTIGSLPSCPDCQEFLLNNRATEAVTWLTDFYQHQNRGYQLFPLNDYILQVGPTFYLLRARQLTRAQQLLKLHLQKNVTFAHGFKITHLDALFLISLEQSAACRDEVVSILTQHPQLSALILKTTDCRGWHLLQRLKASQCQNSHKKPLSI
ncbi:hypothetical protein [Loigolactobacillus bifermentans]|jgi:hypothetical protein|nr:hypothetical protein [Loigolactobacillus bifermentans]QGG61641.1 hypothetical protein LB003_14875 [Loigolactobacillus bifermentans]